MTRDAADKDLSNRASKHIAAEEYAQAEAVIRQRIERADERDSALLWHLFGLLGSVLNSLERPVEATEVLREALRHGRNAAPNGSRAEVARYMLANQLLNFAQPEDALAELTPIAAGTGHVQCLQHSVAAHALWKLERRGEAREAARAALDAAPTDERRSDLNAELEEILTAE